MSVGILGVARTPSSVQQVRIEALTERQCTLGTTQLPERGCFDLWIGAIGPIRSSVVQREHDRVIVAFEEKLESQIVSHFSTT